MKTIGVIVGGGKSSRMGRDKALLVHQGQTLLQHAKNLLTELKTNDVIVLGRADDPDGIDDMEPHKGPAASLQSWWSRQDKPFRLIVLPVDMPFLTPEAILHLMSHRNGAYFDDLYLPFTATITDSAPEGLARMKDLLTELCLTCVQPPQSWSKHLINLNEITDLALLDGKN